MHKLQGYVQTYQGPVLTSFDLIHCQGQGVRFRDPIDAALYDVQHVRKQIREFKVKNSSNALVAHKDLERIT